MWLLTPLVLLYRCAKGFLIPFLWALWFCEGERKNAAACKYASATPGGSARHPSPPMTMHQRASHSTQDPWSRADVHLVVVGVVLHR